jgi:thioredoxin reductase (NADPH)
MGLASEAALSGIDHLFLVGGGNSAGQAAMHFASFWGRVSMIICGDGLKETLSECLVDRILASPQIEVLTRKEVTALEGDQTIQGIPSRRTRQASGRGSR